jgi:hypothetical protein
MTQDDVIRLAEESDLGFLLGDNWMLLHELEAFAKLIAQEVRDKIFFGSRDDWVLAEREACAQVCEQMDHDGVMIAKDCAAAIRARGNT